MFIVLNEQEWSVIQAIRARCVNTHGNINTCGTGNAGVLVAPAAAQRFFNRTGRQITEANNRAGLWYSFEDADLKLDVIEPTDVRFNADQDADPGEYVGDNGAVHAALEALLLDCRGRPISPAEPAPCPEPNDHSKST